MAREEHGLGNDLAQNLHLSFDEPPHQFINFKIQLKTLNNQMK